MGHRTDTVIKRAQISSLRAARSEAPKGEWPAHAVTKLLEWHKRGWTMSQISAELSRLDPPVIKTRNSVIGKLHRLGVYNESRAPGEAVKMRPISWTEEMDAALREHIRLGRTVSVTAELLEARFGISGTKVITPYIVTLRMRKLKVAPNGKKPMEAMTRHFKEFNTNKPPEHIDVISLVPPKCEPIRMADATDKQCHWPTSDQARDMMVCGAPVVRGCYCGFHARVGFQGHRPRTERSPALFRKVQESDIGA